MTGWLAANCPRLAFARIQRCAELAEESRLDLAIRSKRLHLEQRVAHRELQLVRSYQTRDRKYIAVRQAKLKSAEAALRAFERRVAA